MHSPPISLDELKLRARYQAEKENPRCDGCKFFDQQTGSDVGQCRRHPPKAFMISNCESESVWPIVGTDDWCGEHQVDMRLMEIKRTEEGTV